MKNVEKLTCCDYAGYALVEWPDFHYDGATRGTLFVSNGVAVDEEMSVDTPILLSNYVRAEPQVAPVAQVSFVVSAESSSYVHATGI